MIAQPEPTVAAAAGCCCKAGAYGARRRRRYLQAHCALPRRKRWELDRGLGHCGSEVIGEMYVPRGRLVDFMHAAAAGFRRHAVDLIYGTIRLIERDTESFLPWARQDYACVIFNLHTPHTLEGIEATQQALRRLIDMAIARGGSFYLTYSRAATAEQVRACYPDIGRFFEAKRRYDPQQRFQSSWYRHYQPLLAAASAAQAA